MDGGALNEYKFIENLTKGFPHIARGRDDSDGHAWILDGYTNNAYGRHYHINWGYGEESSDGWSIGTFFGDIPFDGSGKKEHIEYREKLQQLYLE